MKKGIQTVNDFFDSTMSALPLATSFVLVLDPESFLGLDGKYVDLANNKTWRVMQYYGNDFTIRREYCTGKDQNKPIILWVTKSPSPKQEKIDLSYIYDVVEKCERTVDLSLQAVLRQLMPGVEWPEQLFEHSKEIGQELSRFHSLYQTLRKELPAKAPLNVNHVKALLIALRNPQISLSELILGSIPIQEALPKYVRIILVSEFDEDERTMLREIIESNVIGEFSEISPWFQFDKDELAVFFYLLTIAKRYNIANPIVQLRGMGLLSFDPEILGENRITRTFESLEALPGIGLEIAKTAEMKLEPRQIGKIIECADLKDPAAIAEAIQNEKLPLITYALSVCYLRETMKRQGLNSSDLGWTKNVGRHPIIVEGIETKFSQKATSLLRLFVNMASVLQSLDYKPEEKKDLSALIDWWKNTGIFKVELALAKVNSYLQAIYDDDLRKVLANYIQRIKKDARAKLEIADLNLASIIERNWKGYLSNPRLATNILHDYILSRGITPSKDRRIWVLIFDGMRLDTWEEIVKPIILSKFEMKEEKLYVSMLPSETDIARVAILAGLSPTEWQDYDGGYTSDHNILASKLFKLSRYEGKEKLRITVSSETDVGQKRLDEGTYLYNVLIYNLSDDWIHTFRGDIQELNDDIKGTLTRKIMPDLDRRIGEKDCVILTSDHGFIELAPEDEVKVFGGSPEIPLPDASRKVIAYRCMRNLEYGKGFRISFPYEFFTVAKGRKWFSRPKGKYSRYVHGGISLDEMVVPGILMEKIAIATVELVLTSSDNIELTEDTPFEFEVKIANNGNRGTQFDLISRTNTGEEERHPGTLGPKEDQIITFSLAKPTLALRNLEVSLSWKTPDGKLTKPEKRIIPIKVNERKDKVEFKFGGLDNIKE